jgi:acyl carrier protein
MSLDKEIVREKVRTYIKTAIHADKTDDTTLIFREGYLDSMGFIMLIAFLEEELGIKTGDADLVEENFESINAITDFVERKS